MVAGSGVIGQGAWMAACQHLQQAEFCFGIRKISIACHDVTTSRRGNATQEFGNGAVRRPPGTPVVMAGLAVLGVCSVGLTAIE